MLRFRLLGGRPSTSVARVKLLNPKECKGVILLPGYRVRGFCATPIHHRLPPKQAMYDPALEKDNCGVGMIANLRKEESHRIVKNALQVKLSIVSGVLRLVTRILLQGLGAHGSSWRMWVRGKHRRRIRAIGNNSGHFLPYQIERAWDFFAPERRVWHGLDFLLTKARHPRSMQGHH